MSTSEEQKEAREYCLHRPLVRPTVNWIKISGIILGAELLAGGLSYFCSLWMGTFFLSYLLINLLLLLFTGKYLLISLVKLYQHYASEETRRKCLCKPTCSEYAILALKKYGVAKGLYKIYIRLFRTCRGIEYGIDYP